jgi:hypothetical protein
MNKDLRFFMSGLQLIKGTGDLKVAVGELHHRRTGQYPRAV